MLNMTSKTIIIIASMNGAKFNPMTKAAIGMTTDKTRYVLDRYSQLKGIRCAPNMIVITISIFSGTVGYIHMAIKRYGIWFTKNRMPRLVSGLSLF